MSIANNQEFPHYWNLQYTPSMAKNVKLRRMLEISKY
jgi:hypothetical protein